MGNELVKGKLESIGGNAEQMIENCRRSNCESLNLYYLNLNVLPNSIGNLTNLRELNLPGNDLTDLPVSMNNLTNLRRLYLGDNNFTDLPNIIGNLTNLTSLNLSSNNFRVFPNIISNLTNLEVLGIGGNRLAFLPDFITNLTKLTTLKFSGNGIMRLSPQLCNFIRSNNIDLGLDNINNICPAVSCDTTIEQANNDIYNLTGVTKAEINEAGERIPCNTTTNTGDYSGDYSVDTKVVSIDGKNCMALETLVDQIRSGIYKNAYTQQPLPNKLVSAIKELINCNYNFGFNIQHPEVVKTAFDKFAEWEPLKHKVGNSEDEFKKRWHNYYERILVDSGIKQRGGVRVTTLSQFLSYTEGKENYASAMLIVMDDIDAEKAEKLRKFDLAIQSYEPSMQRKLLQLYNIDYFYRMDDSEVLEELNTVTKLNRLDYHIIRLQNEYNERIGITNPVATNFVPYPMQGRDNITPEQQRRLLLYLEPDDIRERYEDVQISDDEFNGIIYELRKEKLDEYGHFSGLTHEEYIEERNRTRDMTDDEFIEFLQTLREGQQDSEEDSDDDIEERERNLLLDFPIGVVDMNNLTPEQHRRLEVLRFFGEDEENPDEVEDNLATSNYDFGVYENALRIDALRAHNYFRRINGGDTGLTPESLQELERIRNMSFDEYSELLEQANRDEL